MLGWVRSSVDFYSIQVDLYSIQLKYLEDAKLCAPREVASPCTAAMSTPGRCTAVHSTCKPPGEADRTWRVCEKESRKA